MSDFDLMEPETERELEQAAETSAELSSDAVWPREQMLDRLRTCD
jgi:hypothetical protein